jgi:uncharacterized protein YuzE
MKVKFDQSADAVYIRLDDATIINSAEVGPGVVLDYDADNRIVGIEVLNAQQRLPAAQLNKMLFEVA